MIEYLGSIKFGGIYADEFPLDIPQRPYDTKNEVFRGSGLGDMYSYSDNLKLKNWGFGDTPSEINKKITWHRFKDGGKKIYVCDRVLLNDISIEELSSILKNNYVYIDGIKFICRLLTNEEWINYICNKEKIFGLPKDTFDKNFLNEDSKNLNHNVFWNWVGVYSFTTNGEMLHANGYKKPNTILEISNKLKGSDIGFRPVLEEVTTIPIINGDSGRLGEFNKPFIYNYSVLTYLDDDDLNIVEQINDTLIREFNSTEVNINRKIDLSPYWSDLGTGVQTISITATNKNGDKTEIKAQFYMDLPTFVNKEGLNYFANQLWNGKIKPFSKRQGGLVLDSNETYTGVGVRENTDLVDNGICIKCSVNSEQKILACFATDAVKLGVHGLVLRACTDNKVSSDSFSLTIYKKHGSSRNQISSRTFKGSDFDTVGQYKNFYLTFEYSGSKPSGQTIEVELKTIENSISHNINLDYILISPILPTALI